MTEKYANMEETAHATDEYTATVKSGLAVHHFLSAKFFSSEAVRLEQTNSLPDEKARCKHRAYVMGAVFSATAFLEALINELFISASDGSPYSEFGLDHAQAGALAQIWPEKERLPIIKKYRAALKALSLPDYDKDFPQVNEIRGLVALRNALTHYKPEWDNNLRQHATLSNILDGKFAESPYSDKSQAFFPHRCLGSACATWAVLVAREFAFDFFHSRLDVTKNIPIDSVLVHQAEDVA